MRFALRPYQMEAVEKIRTSYRTGRRAALYVLPTGGGKTACFSYIAESIRAKGSRAIIIAHRQELLAQASKSLLKLGVSHGMISPRFASNQREPIQVASIQTLVRRLDTVAPPDMLIFDEAHHAVSKSYRRVINRFSNARILGVTATPCRTSGEGLDEIFDDLILGPTITDLIEQGYLVAPEIYAPPIGIDISGVKKVMGDYDKRELSARIDKPKITGSAIEHYQKYCAGEPALAFCISIQHAEHVAREFCEAGIRAVRVDGGMDDQARKNALKGLEDGSIDVITSADLIGEGVDIPRVSAAILLRPTHSLGLYLQQVGRALRPYPGKNHAVILDHVGNTLRHGLPDEPREWSLAGSAKNAKKSGDALLIKITQCERCYFIFETNKEQCPSCGHANASKARKIEEVGGELIKLSKEQIAAHKTKSRREQGSAQTLEELINLGKSRGYANPGFWARRVFMGRRR